VRAAWGHLEDLQDTSLPNAGPIGIPVDFTVSKQTPLAFAQLVMQQRLRPAMDMTLCGDAINNLTAWWPTTLTGAGYAIIATTAGIRLDGPIRALARRPTLPNDMPIQDYRMPVVATPRP
jgi:hypothetical protein